MYMKLWAYPNTIKPLIHKNILWIVQHEVFSTPSYSLLFISCLWLSETTQPLAPFFSLEHWNLLFAQWHLFTLRVLLSGLLFEPAQFSVIKSQLPLRIPNARVMLLLDLFLSACLVTFVLNWSAHVHPPFAYCSCIGVHIRFYNASATLC